MRKKIEYHFINKKMISGREDSKLLKGELRKRACTVIKEAIEKGCHYENEIHRYGSKVFDEIMNDPKNGFQSRRLLVSSIEIYDYCIWWLIVRGQVIQNGLHYDLPKTKTEKRLAKQVSVALNYFNREEK